MMRSRWIVESQRRPLVFAKSNSSGGVRWSSTTNPAATFPPEQHASPNQPNNWQTGSGARDADSRTALESGGGCGVISHDAHDSEGIQFVTSNLPSLSWSFLLSLNTQVSGTVRYSLANLSKWTRRLIASRMTLQKACYVGNAGVVATLLENGADPMQPEKRGGQLRITGASPLHIAAYRAHEKVVTLLLAQSGVTVDHPDVKLGFGAIHYACTNGHVSMLQLLLERGADPNLPSATTGHTPLHAAAEGGKVDVVRALLKVPNIRVDQREFNYGRSPLHEACSRGHLDVVRCLVLEGKADLDGVTNQGASSVYIAAHNGHVDVLRLLLSPHLRGGASVDLPLNENLWTALHDAVSRNSTEVLQVLLDHGANPSPRTKKGATPLHIASYKGHVEVARMLLTQTEVNVDLRVARNGFTPLHDAAYAGYKEVVKLLLAHGANPEAETFEGETASGYAAQSGNMEIMKLLREHSAGDVALSTAIVAPLSIVGSAPVSGDKSHHQRLMSTTTLVRTPWAEMAAGQGLWHKAPVNPTVIHTEPWYKTKDRRK